MAFNFMSFLGGAAEQLTEVIETREQERLYDARLDRATERELSTFEKKQKMQAEREASKAEESAKKKAEELSGFLNTFYTDPANVEKIMSGGNTSANYWLELGQLARQQGKDPNTLFKEVETITPEGEDSAELVNEVLQNTPTIQANLEAISDLYKQGEDIYSTIEAAHDAFVQKAYAETDPTKQKTYQAAVDHFKGLIDKELEENAAKGNKDDAKFDTAITKFYNTALNNAANTVEMEGVMEDGIFKLIKGSKAQRNISLLMAAQEMQTFNQIYNEDGTLSGKVKSLNLQDKLKNDVTGAVQKLQSYALQEVDQLSVPDEPTRPNGTKAMSKVKNTMAAPISEADLQKETYKYNYGDIIFVQDESGSVSVRVYTGLNLSKTHNMFINAGIING